MFRWLAMPSSRMAKVLSWNWINLQYIFNATINSEWMMTGVWLDSGMSGRATNQSALATISTSTWLKLPAEYYISNLNSAEIESERKPNFAPSSLLPLLVIINKPYQFSSIQSTFPIYLCIVWLIGRPAHQGMPAWGEDTERIQFPVRTLHSASIAARCSQPIVMSFIMISA